MYRIFYYYLSVKIIFILSTSIIILKKPLTFTFVNVLCSNRTLEVKMHTPISYFIKQALHIVGRQRDFYIKIFVHYIYTTLHSLD